MYKKNLKVYKNNVVLASNRCFIENGGCDHICDQIPGRGYVCSCREGFYLDEDERTCTGI